MFVTINRSPCGDYRVALSANAITFAHLAAQLPAPSLSIIRARQEATAYYTADYTDASDTAQCIQADVLNNPLQLIAERDIPSNLRHGPTWQVRADFQSFIHQFAISAGAVS